ncbi:MAG: MerR family transcriptional regulator [Actinobacteria bacterium]|nr:MerR family transcriptional regulator [Actinomycetota bacterium]
MTATSPLETRQRLLTIGAVCRRLQRDFPDISISKIRYLEDQGLVTPQRTQGGYRLFGEDDVERLETILRLQRDEFLPLRVIRQELATSMQKERRRRRPNGLAGPEDELDLEELCERAGITSQAARELEDFGLLAPRAAGGDKRYGEGDVEIAAVCARLSQFGIAPRHLRTFRTGADRTSALLEQLVAPALRSRSLERRQAGLEDLQSLAELAQELSQLLYWRALRRLASV